MQTPTCLGFIMDGNRRYAKELDLPTLEGHKKGLDVYIDYIRFVRDHNIPHAVFYAFSTENWNRSEAEVSYLMELFGNSLDTLKDEIEERKVRVRILGRKEDFSKELQHKMNQLEEKSAKYTDTTIWMALSYGGRTEIVEAVNKAVASGEEVTEESFSQLLWTAEMPDPDMIIRTSGEHRLSNFLPWQSVYSEFYFIDKHWPALTEADFKDILAEYGKRERRKGK